MFQFSINLTGSGVSYNTMCCVCFPRASSALTWQGPVWQWQRPQSGPLRVTTSPSKSTDQRYGFKQHFALHAFISYLFCYAWLPWNRKGWTLYRFTMYGGFFTITFSDMVMRSLHILLHKGIGVFWAKSTKTLGNQSIRWLWMKQAALYVIQNSSTFSKFFIKFLKRDFPNRLCESNSSHWHTFCDAPLKVPTRPLPFSPLGLLLPQPNVGRPKNLWPLWRVLWEVHATGTQWPARPSPVNSMVGPPLLSAWPQPLQWRDGGKGGGEVLSTPHLTSLVQSSPSKTAATISCLCFRCTEDHFTALSRLCRAASAYFYTMLLYLRLCT